MSNVKKVLLVDDEPDIIEFLSYNLRKRGFEVRSAGNGVQALALLVSYQPDIIITDILMPEMNGISMCREIKNDMRLNGVPVIFLSATADDCHMLSAMKAGAEQYISKPVPVKALCNMISEMLLSKAS